MNNGNILFFPAKIVVPDLWGYVPENRMLGGLLTPRPREFQWDSHVGSGSISGTHG